MRFALWRDIVYSRILMLRFPKETVNDPVVCFLAKDFNLSFAIQHASIFPRKEGVMVLELSGTKANFKKGVKFLESRGVKVQNAAQEVIRIMENCTHCGACTAVCLTGALSIKRPEMSVEFDQEKCNACELCVHTCPTRAMKVNPKNEKFF